MIATMSAWAAKHIIFSILFSVVCRTMLPRAIAEHSQGFVVKFPRRQSSVTSRREYSCTVARSHIFTGIGRFVQMRDMIADLTTRPGSLWRKLTIHDVVGLGVCPPRYSLDFVSQIRPQATPRIFRWQQPAPQRSPSS